MIQKALIALFILGLACSQALASITIERDVTVTDANGGSMALTTNGQANAAGSDSVTVALFTNFSGVQANRTVNGEVVRNRSRGEGELDISYSGVLEIESSTGPEGPVTLNVIEFNALSINRDGDGPELSGEVIYNGETIDAADLTAQQARLLRRTLRFFRFA
ncbi:MAG: hypothetical protein AAGH65_00095 [Pseudomonadota bacterium]